MSSLGEIVSRKEFEIIDAESQGKGQPEWGLQLEACLAIAGNMEGEGQGTILDTSDIELHNFKELYRRVDEVLGIISRETGFRIL